MKPTTFLPHPIRVEAVQLTVDNLEEVAEWCKGYEFKALSEDGSYPGGIEIPGDEGLCAMVGDWIVSHPTLGFSVESDADFKLLYFTY